MMSKFMLKAWENVKEGSFPCGPQNLFSDVTDFYKDWANKFGQAIPEGPSSGGVSYTYASILGP